MDLITFLTTFFGLIVSFGGGLFTLIKLGLLKISIGKNGNGHQAQIEQLFNHAEIANGEMGAIKESIIKIEVITGELKNDYRQHLIDDKEYQKESREQNAKLLEIMYQIKNK